MKTILRIIFSMIILSVPIAHPTFAATASPSATNNNLRAAAALFNRYETIFYTNTDLSTPLTIFKGLSRPAASSLSIPFGQLPSGLDLLNKHASSEILGNADAVLMGARNFVNPRAAGSAGYPAFFCFVVVYGKQPIPTSQNTSPKPHRLPRARRPFGSGSLTYTVSRLSLLSMRPRSAPPTS